MPDPPKLDYATPRSERPPDRSSVLRLLFTSSAALSLLLFLLNCAAWINSRWDGTIGLYYLPYPATAIVTGILPVAWLLDANRRYGEGSDWPR